MKKEEKECVLRIGRVLFAIYIVIMVYFLFFCERYGRGFSHEYRYNLVLFSEIKRFFKYRHLMSIESFVLNMMGNVVAFMPFGFFIPMLSKKKRFINVALLSFQFTLAIEMVQLFTKVGIFDVDDLFLNTLGGILGYLCYVIGHGAYTVWYGLRRSRVC